jgi:carbamoyltransferase
MIISGFKLTHDGAFCIIDNGALIFCYEVEKINNNPRYSDFNLTNKEIESISNCYGYSKKNITEIVVDGWNNDSSRKGAAKKRQPSIEMNGYDPFTGKKEVLHAVAFDTAHERKSHTSYQHISSHIVGAYCTSPFAKNTESSFILIWDGAIAPQLYYFNSADRIFEKCGWVHYIYGQAYSQFAAYYPPFDLNTLDDLGTAGKIMAYIAKGRTNPVLLNQFSEKYKEYQVGFGKNDITLLQLKNFSTSLLDEFHYIATMEKIQPDDALRTFHEFLQALLIEGIALCLKQFPQKKPTNLCYAGGCALNIKWNSALRNTGLFKNTWIPPFPNDSGSALGTACCAMISHQNIFALDWNVYQGPKLIPPDKTAFQGWSSRQCSITELATVLFTTQEPVVFLNGAAELGPRSLGNRSIFCSAANKENLDHLNKIKKRESYRPVAPICLEEKAASIFDPGTPDPYMLYEHYVRPAWQSKVPAIVHLDGSARLQTVNALQNKLVYDLLRAYAKISGIPVLCNTSANANGKGFFPDIGSAINWGGCSYVWSEGILWFKNET